MRKDRMSRTALLIALLVIVLGCNLANLVTTNQTAPAVKPPSTATPPDPLVNLVRAHFEEVMKTRGCEYQINEVSVINWNVSPAEQANGIKSRKTVTILYIVRISGTWLDKQIGYVVENDKPNFPMYDPIRGC